MRDGAAIGVGQPASRGAEATGSVVRLHDGLQRRAFAERIDCLDRRLAAAGGFAPLEALPHLGRSASGMTFKLCGQVVPEL